MSRRRNRGNKLFSRLVCEAVMAGAVRPDEWYFQCSNGDFVGAWGQEAADIWGMMDEVLRRGQRLDVKGLTYADVERAVEAQGVWESSRARGRQKLFKRVV